jgi:UrcA family protein
MQRSAPTLVQQSTFASSDTFLEIEHARTDCPVDPQHLARLNGTTDDCAGGFRHLDAATHVPYEIPKPARLLHDDRRNCTCPRGNSQQSIHLTHWSVSYPLSYSDLDMSKMSGAKILCMRFAAETLCESAATWGKKEGDACVNKAVNDAVARINAPRLTQYAQSNGDKAGLVQLANAN